MMILNSEIKENHDFYPKSWTQNSGPPLKRTKFLYKLAKYTCHESAKIHYFQTNFISAPTKFSPDSCNVEACDYDGGGQTQPLNILVLF